MPKDFSFNSSLQPEEFAKSILDHLQADESKKHEDVIVKLGDQALLSITYSAFSRESRAEIKPLIKDPDNPLYATAKLAQQHLLTFFLDHGVKKAIFKESDAEKNEEEISQELLEEVINLGEFCDLSTEDVIIKIGSDAILQLRYIHSLDGVFEINVTPLDTLGQVTSKAHNIGLSLTNLIKEHDKQYASNIVELSSILDIIENIPDPTATDRTFPIDFCINPRSVDEQIVTLYKNEKSNGFEIHFKDLDELPLGFLRDFLEAMKSSGKTIEKLTSSAQGKSNHYFYFDGEPSSSVDFKQFITQELPFILHQSEIEKAFPIFLQFKNYFWTLTVDAFMQNPYEENKLNIQLDKPPDGFSSFFQLLQELHTASFASFSVTIKDFTFDADGLFDSFHFSLDFDTPNCLYLDFRMKDIKALETLNPSSCIKMLERAAIQGFCNVFCSFSLHVENFDVLENATFIDLSKKAETKIYYPNRLDKTNIKFIKDALENSANSIQMSSSKKILIETTDELYEILKKPFKGPIQDLDELEEYLTYAFSHPIIQKGFYRLYSSDMQPILELYLVQSPVPHLACRLFNLDSSKEFNSHPFLKKLSKHFENHLKMSIEIPFQHIEVYHVSSEDKQVKPLTFVSCLYDNFEKKALSNQTAHAATKRPFTSQDDTICESIKQFRFYKLTNSYSGSTILTREPVSDELVLHLDANTHENAFGDSFQFTLDIPWESPCHKILYDTAPAFYLRNEEKELSIEQAQKYLDTFANLEFCEASINILGHKLHLKKSANSIIFTPLSDANESKISRQLQGLTAPYPFSSFVMKHFVFYEILRCKNKSQPSELLQDYLEKTRLLPDRVDIVNDTGTYSIQKQNDSFGDFIIEGPHPIDHEEENELNLLAKNLIEKRPDSIRSLRSSNKDYKLKFSNIGALTTFLTTSQQNLLRHAPKLCLCYQNSSGDFIHFTLAFSQNKEKKISVSFLSDIFLPDDDATYIQKAFEYIDMPYLWQAGYPQVLTLSNEITNFKTKIDLQKHYKQIKDDFEILESLPTSCAEGFNRLFEIENLINTLSKSLPLFTQNFRDITSYIEFLKTEPYQLASLPLVQKELDNIFLKLTTIENAQTKVSTTLESGFYNIFNGPLQTLKQAIETSQTIQKEKVSLTKFLEEHHSSILENERELKTIEGELESCDKLQEYDKLVSKFLKLSYSINEHLQECEVLRKKTKLIDVLKTFDSFTLLQLKQKGILPIENNTLALDQQLELLGTLDALAIYPVTVEHTKELKKFADKKEALLKTYLGKSYNFKTNEHIKKLEAKLNKYEAQSSELQLYVPHVEADLIRTNSHYLEGAIYHMQINVPNILNNLEALKDEINLQLVILEANFKHLKEKNISAENMLVLFEGLDFFSIIVDPTELLQKNKEALDCFNTPFIETERCKELCNRFAFITKKTFVDDSFRKKTLRQSEDEILKRNLVDLYIKRQKQDPLVDYLTCELHESIANKSLSFKEFLETAYAGKCVLGPDETYTFASSSRNYQKIIQAVEKVSSKNLDSSSWYLHPSVVSYVSNEINNYREQSKIDFGKSLNALQNWLKSVSKINVGIEDFFLTPKIKQEIIDFLFNFEPIANELFSSYEGLQKEAKAYQQSQVAQAKSLVQTKKLDKNKKLELPKNIYRIFQEKEFLSKIKEWKDPSEFKEFFKGLQEKEKTNSLEENEVYLFRFCESVIEIQSILMPLFSSQLFENKDPDALISELLYLYAHKKDYSQQVSIRTDNLFKLLCDAIMFPQDSKTYEKIIFDYCILSLKLGLTEVSSRELSFNFYQFLDEYARKEHPCFHDSPIAYEADFQELKESFVQALPSSFFSSFHPENDENLTHPNSLEINRLLEHINLAFHLFYDKEQLVEFENIPINPTEIKRLKLLSGKICRGVESFSKTGTFFENLSKTLEEQKQILEHENASFKAKTKATKTSRLAALQNEVQDLQSKQVIERYLPFIQSTLDSFKSTRLDYTFKNEREELKQVKHLINDGYLGSSVFEGSNLSKTSQYSQAFIRQIPKDISTPPSSGLLQIPLCCPDYYNQLETAEIALDQIQTTSTILYENCADKEDIQGKLLPYIQSEIHEKNECFLIGGYNSKPAGHSMVYSLEKKCVDGIDKTYFHIFNTGEGIIFHPMFKDASGKTRLFPILSYEIDPSLCIDENGSFTPNFNRFLVDTFAKNLPKNDNYDANKLYLAIKESMVRVFQAKPIIADWKMNRMISPQKSETCSQQVLRPVLGSCIKEYEDYKLFITELQLSCFIKSYVRHQANLPFSLVWQETLKDGASKLSIRLLKHILLEKQKKEPSEFKINQYEKALALVAYIQNETQNTENTSPHLKASCDNIQAVANSKAFMALPITELKHKHPYQTVQSFTSAAAPSFSYQPPKECNFTHPKRFCESLEIATKRAREIKYICDQTRDYSPLYLYVTEIINAMISPHNIENDFYSIANLIYQHSLTKDELSQISHNIKDLSIFLMASALYLKNESQSSTINAQSYINMITLKCISYSISCCISYSPDHGVSVFENYSIGVDEFNRFCDQGHLSLEDDPHLHFRLQSISNYFYCFNKFPKKNPPIYQAVSSTNVAGFISSPSHVPSVTQLLNDLHQSGVLSSHWKLSEAYPPLPPEYTPTGWEKLSHKVQLAIRQAHDIHSWPPWLQYHNQVNIASNLLIYGDNQGYLTSDKFRGAYNSYANLISKIDSNNLMTTFHVENTLVNCHYNLFDFANGLNIYPLKNSPTVLSSQLFSCERQIKDERLQHIAMESSFSPGLTENQILASSPKPNVFINPHTIDKLSSLSPPLDRQDEVFLREMLRQKKSGIYHLLELISEKRSLLKTHPDIQELLKAKLCSPLLLVYEFSANPELPKILLQKLKESILELTKDLKEHPSSEDLRLMHTFLFMLSYSASMIQNMDLNFLDSEFQQGKLLLQNTLQTLSLDPNIDLSYRSHFHILKLLAIPKGLIKFKNKKEFLENYIESLLVIAQNTKAPDIYEPLIEQTLQLYLSQLHNNSLQLISELSPADFTNLLDEKLSKLGLENLINKESNWINHEKFPHLYSNGKCSIDLLGARLLQKDEVICGIPSSVINRCNGLRHFIPDIHKVLAKVSQESTKYTFSHEGEDYQLLTADVSSKCSRFVFQKAFTFQVSGKSSLKKCYAQYEDTPNSLFYKKLPHFLKTDRFCYFHTPENSVIVYDKQTKSPICLLSGQKDILYYHSDTQTFGPESLVDTAFLKSTWGNRGFDHAELSLVWKIPGSEHTLLSYPRYKGLNFSGREALVWHSDSSLALIKNPKLIEPHNIRLLEALYLGDTASVIQNKKPNPNSQKVLVPCNFYLFDPIAKDRYESDSGYSRLFPRLLYGMNSPITEKTPISEAKVKKQKGHFEFSIQDGKLMPKSDEFLEGCLYLMYLAYAQRQYSEVSFYYAKISSFLSSSKDLSDFTELLIMNFLKLSERDNTANGTVWALKICSLYERAKAGLALDQTIEEKHKELQKHNFFRECQALDEASSLEKQDTSNFFFVQYPKKLLALFNLYTENLTAQEIDYRIDEQDFQRLENVCHHFRQHRESQSIASLQSLEPLFLTATTGSEALQEKSPAPPLDLIETKDLFLGACGANEELLKSEALVDIFDFAHPGKALAENFFVLYEWALSQDFEKKQVVRYLLLASQAEDSSYQVLNEQLRNILTYLLFHSQDETIKAPGISFIAKAFDGNIKTDEEAFDTLKDYQVGHYICYYDPEQHFVKLVIKLEEGKQATSISLDYKDLLFSGFKPEHFLNLSHLNEEEKEAFIKSIKPIKSSLPFVIPDKTKASPFFKKPIPNVLTSFDPGQELEVLSLRADLPSLRLKYKYTQDKRICFYNTQNPTQSYFFLKEELENGITLGGSSTADIQVDSRYGEEILSLSIKNDAICITPIELNFSIVEQVPSYAHVLLCLFDGMILSPQVKQSIIPEEVPRQASSSKLSYINFRSFVGAESLSDRFDQTHPLLEASDGYEASSFNCSQNELFDKDNSFPVFRPLSDIIALQLTQSDGSLDTTALKDFFEPQLDLEQLKSSTKPYTFSRHFSTLSKNAPETDQRFIAHKLDLLDKDYASGRQKNLLEKQVLSKQLENLEKLVPSQAKNDLQCSIEETTLELELKEKQILLLAKSNLDSFEIGHESAHKRKAITLEQIFKIFLQEDKEAFYKYLHLNNPQIKQLHAHIHEYLLLKTKAQQTELALSCFPKDDTIPLTEEQKSTLCRILSQKRAYDPFESGLYSQLSKACLFFEASSGFILRQDQVEAIRELLTLSGQMSFQNLLKQIIMGGGKSKVLLPILAMCKARGDNLVMIMVPKALYETARLDFSKTVQEVFGMETFSFQFHRQTPHSRASLEALETELLSSIKDRKFVIVDDETLQNMELVYIDWKSQLFEHPTLELEEKVSKLEDLLALLEHKTDLLIDEVDTVLKVSDELIHPKGDKKELLDPHLLCLTLQLYEAFEELPIDAQNPQKGIFKQLLDNDSQDEISLTNYLQATKDLSESLIDKAFVFECFDEGPQELSIYTACQKVISNLTKQDLSRFLGGGAASSAIINFLEKVKACSLEELSPQDKLIAELISLAKEQITQMLKDSLSQKSNENYGLSLNEDTGEVSPLIIPYKGANDPDKGSVFSSPYKAAHYAAQAYRVINISENETAHFIQEILKKAQYQQIQMAKEPSSEALSLDLTPEAMKFEQIFGEKISNFSSKQYKDEQLANFTLRFNELKKINRKALNYYIETRVGPLLFTYSEKLKSTPQNHADITRSVQAITGTPWNSEALNTRIHTDLKAGIDGITIDHLLEKNAKVNFIDNSSSVSVEKILEANTQQGLAQPLRAIIDAGALLKNQSNQKTAQDLLDLLTIDANCPYYQSSIKGVLYFDNAKNTLHALVKGKKDPIEIGSSDFLNIRKKTGLEVDQFFSFYDQKHSTGTDIQQIPQARAITTISNNTYLRDLLQAVMRLRELGKLQTTDFILPASMQANGITSVEAIISLCVSNQARQQAKENIQGAILNTKNLFRRQVLKGLKSLENKQNYSDVEKSRGRFYLDHLLEYDRLNAFENFSGKNTLKNTYLFLTEIQKRLLNLIEQESLNQHQLLDKEEDKEELKAYLEELVQIKITLKNDFELLLSKLFPLGESPIVPEDITLTGSSASNGSVQVKAAQKSQSKSQEESQLSSSSHSCEETDVDAFTQFTLPPFSNTFALYEVANVLSYFGVSQETEKKLYPPFYQSSILLDPQDIHFSLNFLMSTNSTKKIYQKRLSKLLCICDPHSNTLTSIAISEEEFMQIQNQLNHPAFDPLQLFITTPMGDIIRKSTPEFTIPETLSETFQRTLEKVRLINDDFTALLKQKIYSQWIKSVNVKSYLESEFTNHLSAEKKNQAQAVFEKAQKK